MKVNIKNTQKLIEERFRGNCTWFAEVIGVSRPYLSLILNQKKPLNSPKISEGIMKYCEQNNLDYTYYLQ